MLIFVHRDDLVAVYGGIVGNQQDTCSLGSFDDGFEGCRADRVDQDDIITGVDEIIDSPDLGGDISPRTYNL